MLRIDDEDDDEDDGNEGKSIFGAHPLRSILGNLVGDGNRFFISFISCSSPDSPPSVSVNVFPFRRSINISFPSLSVWVEWRCMCSVVFVVRLPNGLIILPYKKADVKRKACRSGGVYTLLFRRARFCHLQLLLSRNQDSVMGLIRRAGLSA